MAIFVIAVTSALVISFLCSIFESVLLSVSPATIGRLNRKNRHSGTILREFKKHIDVPIAAILIVNTVAHTVGATIAGASYVDVFGDQALWVFSLVFTVAVLLFTEIIPKTLGVTYAAKLAPPVAHGIRYLTLVLKPLVSVASAISRSLRGSRDATLTSIEDIRLLTAVGRHEGVVGAKTARIIDGATRLHELTAQDVLLPRNRVVMLTGRQSVDEVFDVLKRSGHSRFPFTPTGEPDDISGIVLAKELLFGVPDRSDSVPWEELVRPPILVPETKSLNMLLQTFRDERRHMAIVVDEYGSVQGIVTLEDVLEELVGDIIDESDQPIEDLRTRPDGSFEALGSIEMRRLGSQLGMEWDADEVVVTLGGFMAERLDRIPRRGDEVVWNDFLLTVTKASRTRAEIVHISPLRGRVVKDKAPE